MKTAIDLVQEERLRQSMVYGFDSKHDDEHKNGELALAASSYAQHAGRQMKYNSATIMYLRHQPETWPWDEEWWKPSPDALRNAVKAAALIVAEIERLQRLRRG